MKSRLDLLLVARGLAATRQRAQAMILAGRISVDGLRIDKAGASIDEDADVRVAGPAMPYVSRGGLKLQAALDAFAIDPSGQVCLDVGASTGGFTDCLLQRGARRVYAVDVGYGQLDAKLRDDSRVVLRERLNARYLDRTAIPEPAAVATVDLSFISARLVLPAVAPLMSPGGILVVLVKPQFEAGRKEVSRGGVVKSEAVRRRTVEAVEAAGRALGLEPIGSLPSPVLGARGNQEFLLVFRASGSGS
ncbi:MAG TPA: TlyA family RNA methyltransferase [Thermoanaerobaculia bacterium]|nr:TlyA family RNA methyltransferase [Thermoanaerobaculia bacterium]